MILEIVTLSELISFFVMQNSPVSLRYFSLLSWLGPLFLSASFREVQSAASPRLIHREQGSKSSHFFFLDLQATHATGIRNDVEQRRFTLQNCGNCGARVLGITKSSAD
jgi:hypothetical protein